MARFVKYILAFSLPFVVLFSLYFIFDPFKVIKHYDNYYCESGGDVNRSFVSTMNYLNKKDLYHYDSFIFGNSRSLFYRIDDWKQYLPEKSKCYHFSESGGSIKGIALKIRLIDSLHESINNALIVIDCGLLKGIYTDGALFIMPPALTDNSNWFKFHTEHFSQWMNPKFIFYWVKHRLTGKYEQSMDSYIVNGANYPYYDPITNEEPNHIQDSLIAAGVYYNEERINRFKGKQSPKISESLIINNEEIKDYLKEMHNIFAKHHTNYKIIISPIYNQIKLNPKDLNYLNNLFGRDNVYDFSGVNQFTSDYHNYYESSHYLPSVASDIMSIVYNNDMNTANEHK